jgi:hypothetical protein
MSYGQTICPLPGGGALIHFLLNTRCRHLASHNYRLATRPLQRFFPSGKEKSQNNRCFSCPGSGNQKTGKNIGRKLCRPAPAKFNTGLSPYFLVRLMFKHYLYINNRQKILCSYFIQQIAQQSGFFGSQLTKPDRDFPDDRIGLLQKI